MEKEYLEFVKSRKSIREFLMQKIPDNILHEILECGRWAPSGLNNQPWKVCAVIHPTVKRMISELTKYSGIIEDAYVCLVVFYDIDKGYDRIKDILGIGAFMENILLGVHAYPNLGAVWLGEILNQKEKVNEIFKFSSEKFELMGVIAIGVVEEATKQTDKKPRERRSLDDFVEWF